MKKTINEILVGNNKKVSALIAFLILIFIVLGCFGGRSRSTPIPAAYQGEWDGQEVRRFQFVRMERAITFRAITRSKAEQLI